MVRPSDPMRLRAHQARFDVARLSRDGLDPLDARRLDALLDRPYEELSGADVACALDVMHRAGLHAPLFAYFLPAVLRRPPFQDVVASERFLEGLEGARGDLAVADWNPEIEATLTHWLTHRPMRGGDDPVDLYLSEAGLRRHEIEAARRLPTESRLRSCLGTDWRRASEGPLYPRAVLVLLDRAPAKAVARLTSLERSEHDNLRRAWIEILMHAHGVGWRPESREAVEWLDAPKRMTFAEGLMGHLELDIAIGAAAAAILMSPRRARELRERASVRLTALDASDSDKFVLTPIARRLLTGS